MDNQILPPESDISASPGTSGGLAAALVPGLGAYFFSSLIVLLGAAFGQAFLPLAPVAQARRGDLLRAFTNWDGQWYTVVVNQGYDYRPGVHSTVAFFPAYPMLSRIVAGLFGLPTIIALLLVSHLCLAAAFVVFTAYLRERCRNGPPGWADFSLLAFALFPTTMFFRMAYSESLFVLVLSLFLYGTERRWPLPLLALIVGLGTTCRVPGVGVIPPLLLHIWQQSSSLQQRVTRLCLLVPLSCCGLAAWMLYQGLAFGEPLAFVKTQAAWRIHLPAPAADKWTDLLSFAPIGSVYDPSSPGYWARLDKQLPALFSLQFANPLYFVLASAAVALGWLQGWLRPVEAVLAACLLIIPYVASSYELYMTGASRFAAVVLPVYLVVGRLFCRFSAVVSIMILAVNGFLLGAYAGLFASLHRLI